MQISEQILTIEEIDDGVFQSIFPENFSEHSYLHASFNDAYIWLKETKERFQIPNKIEIEE